MSSAITNGARGCLELYKDKTSNSVTSADFYDKVKVWQGKGALLLFYIEGWVTSQAYTASVTVPVDNFISAFDALENQKSFMFIGGSTSSSGTYVYGNARKGGNILLTVGNVTAKFSAYIIL